MISSLKTANYQCFLLITGEPVKSENHKKKFEVKFSLATRCKKPFLDTNYGFCSRAWVGLKKITIISDIIKIRIL